MVTQILIIVKKCVLYINDCILCEFYLNEVLNQIYRWPLLWTELLPALGPNRPNQSGVTQTSSTPPGTQ
jgi:hypothetical protein